MAEEAYHALDDYTGLRCYVVDRHDHWIQRSINSHLAGSGNHRIHRPDDIEEISHYLISQRKGKMRLFVAVAVFVLGWIYWTTPEDSFHSLTIWIGVIISVFVAALAPLGLPARPAPKTEETNKEKS